jgi:hypothetical protein
VSSLLGVVVTVVALLVLGVDVAVPANRILALERAVARVAVVVAEVALLTQLRVEEAVATLRDQAQVRARVEIVEVAVVALLAHLHDPVAAALDLARAAAAVVVLLVAVVAGFGGSLRPVTADVVLAGVPGPASHSSPSWTMPSPQVAALQSLEHASSSTSGSWN